VSARAIAPVVAAPVAVLTPLQRPMLQRTCDCGEHTGGGECDDCKKKKKMPLQRHTNGSMAPAIAPPVVHDVLRSPGHPLDEGTQTYFTSRFGHDFSHVRVHTDQQAAESARAVGALAYTVGNHLVFGAERYSPATGSGRRLLAHELTHVVQQQHDSAPSPQHRLEIGPSQDRYEREADELADRTASGMEASQEPDSNLSLNPLSLTHLSPTLVAPRVQRAEASASTAPAPSPTAVPLLVEDDARDTKPGQMRKGEFLDKLQVSVCATADEVLSSVGRSAQGCPFIERWIGHLRTKNSQFVERGIRKYAPQSAGVTKAQDYIPFVADRVRRGVMRWAQTGEITEVPDELKGQLMGANLLAGVDRLLSGIGGAIGGAVSAIAGGVKKAASVIGSVFAKERDGGVRDAGDPQEIRARLRSGHPLDTGVKSRMEPVFGGDFSAVRVHTDSSAAELSSTLNARAFTIGRDVAFGVGEYQPGTLIGDALIAHELAHVMQQGNEGSAIAPLTQGAAEYNALEEDADVSAVGAMISLWSGTSGAVERIGKNAMPSLRSGLKLQRCGASQTRKAVAGPKSVTAAPELKQDTAPAPQDKSKPARVDAHGKECPDTVEIAELKSAPPFEKRMLDAGLHTFLATVSNMRVGPKDSYEACITEKLAVTEDTCGHEGNMSQTEHCGEKKHCMKVGDTCGGDTLGYATFPCSPNTFVDRHETHNELSLLDGKKTECKVTCLQRYGCGGVEIGRFLITRHYKAGFLTVGGKKIPITTGTIEKVPTTK
jgi:hypothetical protein